MTNEMEHHFIHRPFPCWLVSLLTFEVPIQAFSSFFCCFIHTISYIDHFLVDLFPCWLLKCLFKPLVRFSVALFAFFSFICRYFYIYLLYESFGQYMYCQYLLCDCFFTILMVIFFDEQKFLILILIFPFCLEFFVSCLWKLCLPLGHQDTLLYFLQI